MRKENQRERRKMTKFYCPGCDLPIGTVCSCCYICSECRTIISKDILEKYMKQRLKEIEDKKK
jgi:hypothetical protein